MIESYAVGGVFKIVDEASRTLATISDRLGSLDRLIKQVQESFNKIGSFGATKAFESIENLDGRLRVLGEQLTGLGTKFGTLDAKSAEAITGVSANFAKADTAIGTTTAAVDRLGERMRQIGTDAREMGSVYRLGAGGGGAGGGGGRGNHIGPGHVGPHGAEVGMNLGMIGSLGAGEAARGVADVIKRGMELTHVQEQMVQGGMTAAEVAKATAASWSEAAKHGLSVVKVMEDIKELRFPFGSTEHAIEFIDPLEKMRVVLNSVSEGKGNESADSVYKMARAGELKGLVDPEQYLSYFERMTQVISATGGKVGPNDFMQATKFSKLAGFGFDEDFYTKYLPTLIQTMGATTAGQSMMSLFNTLNSGAVTKRSLGQMDALGLIGDPSKIVYDNFGQPKGMNPGAIKGSDELIRNPLKWAEDVLTPLLEKRFGDLSIASNKETAIENLGGLFGNRNTAAAIAELALRSKAFERDSGLIGEAKGLGGADRLLSNDPTAAMNTFQHSWENLLISLGQPSVKSAVDTMNGVSGAMGGITKWAGENPGVTKTLMEGAVAIAGALAILTGVGIIAALALFLPGGAWAIGAAALVSTLGTLAAFNWDGFKAALGIGQSPAVGGNVPDLSTQTWSDWWHMRAPITPSAPAAAPLSPQSSQDLMKGLFPGLDPLGLPSGFHKTAYSSNATYGGSSPAEDIIFRGTYRALMQAIFGGRGGAPDGGGGLTNASFETDGGGTYGGGSAPSIRYGRQHSRGAALPGTSPADGVGRFASGVPTGPAGKFRPVYHLSAADTDQRVIDTIAGEVSTHSGSGVDAVVNNMLNRVGSHGWGPSGNLLEVARARGQYAGYRHASAAETAFIRSRIEAIASGGVEDNTHGANSYRASFYHGPWYRKHADGAVIGGNRYGFEAGIPNGPYAPYATPRLPAIAAPMRQPGAPAPSASQTKAMTTASMPPIIIENHSHTHLDGRRIASRITRHQVAMADRPTSNGGMDSHAMFSGGAVPLPDAA